jgi:DNA (cytosine-5)-methyltransferase 1
MNTITAAPYGQPIDVTGVIDWDRLEAEQFAAFPATFVLTMDVAIDLFAGPGGWDEGIRMLGERTNRPDMAKGVLGFEFEPTATATARANGHKRCHGDLSKVNPAYFSAPLLIASPPCQGFSPAGKGRGREDFEHLLFAIEQIRLWLSTGRDGMGMSPEHAINWLGTVIADSKSALILEPLRWVIRMASLPRAIAQEQVKTCLPIWEAMAAVYRDLGYSVWTGLVHSEEYGVPQTRVRAVLLASLDVDVTAGPTKTHGKYNARMDRDAQRVQAIEAGLKPWVTMSEALGWSDDTFTHMGDVYNSKGCIRRGDAPAPTMTASMDNGNFRSFNAADIEHDGLRDRIRKSDGPVAEVEGDTSWVYNRPSVTVVGSFRPDVAAAPGWRKPGDGPRQKAPGSVRLSQVEQGILQSFPADYKWQGSESLKFQQAGNAVPCLMAAALVETVEV